MTEPRPTIRPTGWRAVVVAAMLGAGVTWLVTQGLQYAGAALPTLGTGSWVPMLLLAALTGWLAWITHQAVGVRREALEPRTAVMRLQLAKAGVLAAAALGAGYLALVGVSLGDGEKHRRRGERVDDGKQGDDGAEDQFPEVRNM